MDGGGRRRRRSTGRAPRTGRAFDSDGIRDRPEAEGIEGIVLRRENRKKASRNDGRKLRRYKRRTVERTHAWLGHFRRLLVRHEHRIDVYRAFFHLALMILTVRRL